MKRRRWIGNARSVGVEPTRRRLNCPLIVCSSSKFVPCIVICVTSITISRQGSVEEAAASRENEKQISQRLALEAAEVKKGLGDNGNKHRDVSHAHASP